MSRWLPYPVRSELVSEYLTLRIINKHRQISRRNGRRRNRLTPGYAATKMNLRVWQTTSSASSRRSGVGECVHDNLPLKGDPVRSMGVSRPPSNDGGQSDDKRIGFEWTTTKMLARDTVRKGQNDGPNERIVCRPIRSESRKAKRERTVMISRYQDFRSR
jgi:hypothetical protein